ncbi:hypothetical protein APHAL10511_005677 [Amanita phalloides]|nr:hypothetical protein APHAL10511_005677 [Amanita phalloides]
MSPRATTLKQQRKRKTRITNKLFPVFQDIADLVEESFTYTNADNVIVKCDHMVTFVYFEHPRKGDSKEFKSWLVDFKNTVADGRKTAHGAPWTPLAALSLMD